MSPPPRTWHRQAGKAVPWSPKRKGRDGRLLSSPLIGKGVNFRFRWVPPQAMAVASLQAKMALRYLIPYNHKSVLYLDNGLLWGRPVSWPDGLWLRWWLGSSLFRRSSALLGTCGASISCIFWSTGLPASWAACSWNAGPRSNELTSPPPQVHVVTLSPSLSISLSPATLYIPCYSLYPTLNALVHPSPRSSLPVMKTQHHTRP